MSQKILWRTKESALAVKALDSNKNENNDENQFDSLVVLEFSLKVPPPAIQWIIDKIKLLKSKGGGELLVCPIVDENHEVDLSLFLSRVLSGFTFEVINKIKVCAFHHHNRDAYLYNGCLAWYNVLITSRVQSSVKSQFTKVRQINTSPTVE